MAMVLQLESCEGDTAPVQLFELPIPPSVNQLFRNVRGLGRVRTKQYRAWSTAAGWELRAQNPATVAGHVAVNVRAGWPKHRRDLDNILKPLCDLLTEHRVIEDDARVVVLMAQWDRNLEAGRCDVTVTGVPS